MKKLIGIYKITNPKNKIYIGQSINIYKRFNQYRKLECKNQTKIYNSLLKYGYNNHLFEIIHICNINELNEKERYYQELFDSIKTGLNCVFTRTDLLNGVVSQETRNKLSMSLKGRILTNEHKNKISLGNINKKRTPEMIKQMSITSKNITPEHRKSLSDYAKKRVFSLETRQKMSISRKKYVFTEETKTKISISKKGNKNINFGKIYSYSERRNLSEKLGRLYLNTSTGIYYYGLTDVSTTYNIKRDNLKFMIKGLYKNKTDIILC